MGKVNDVLISLSCLGFYDPGDEACRTCDFSMLCCDMWDEHMDDLARKARRREEDDEPAGF